MTAHAPPATIAQGGRRGPRILTMAYSVSPSGLMRWNVEITWRCSMGRVFDFMHEPTVPGRQLCCPGAPPAPAAAQSRRPRVVIPDKRYTALSAFICYFAVRTRTSVFPGIPRYASRDRRGIPGARRSPYTTIMTTILYRMDLPYRIDLAAGTRGHARTHR